MKDEPLVSCLCVTRDRVPMLKRAIRSFRDQDYGHKELVIVYESDDGETEEFLREVSDGNILKIKVPAEPRLTLGELRNLALKESTGEYFCQWDDDDFYHNQRVSFQMEVLRESAMPACVMVHWLIYDLAHAQAYVSNMRPWEGSLLCKKSLIDEELKYEDKGRGEDTVLISELFTRNLAFPVIMPKLYIYVYHGGNVWTDEHWGRIFSASTKLSEESSRVIRDILDGKYTGDEASGLLDDITE